MTKWLEVNMKENMIEPMLSSLADTLVQLIIFRVSDEEFAIPIESTQEIIKAATIVPIPHSPKYIKGLMSVRGDIVPTIDLRERLLLPATNVIAKHIVITKYENNLIGLLVDEVLEVLRINPDDIKKPPRLVTKIHKDLVDGLITYEGRLIISLNIEKVLSEEQLSKVHQMTMQETMDKREHGTKKKSSNLKNRNKDL